MKKILLSIILLTTIALSMFFNQDRTKLFIQTNKAEKTNVEFRFIKTNEIEKIVLPEKTIEYKFDEYNRRKALYVNNELIQKYIWIEKNKPLAITNPNGEILQEYIYKNKSDKLPFSMRKNGKSYFLIYNKMKSLRVVIDKNRNIVKAINYNDKGQVVKDTNPSFKVMFGYAGGVYEEESKLLYFQEGVYSISSQEWITKIKDQDIIKNLKELNSTNPNDVYECKDTLETYYHSYLCTQNQCGGLYANGYLNYIDGSGDMIDNSNYFNKKVCKRIDISHKNLNPNAFSQCVYKKIQPQTDKLFDVFKNNCHHETTNIIETCSNQSLINKESNEL